MSGPRATVLATLVATLLVAGCSANDATGTIAIRDASDPTLACDPKNGDAMAVWAVHAGEHAAAWSAWIPSREGHAVRVSPEGEDVGPRREGPAQVALGPGGEVYVLWAAKRAVAARAYPASDLQLATSRDGGKTFEPPVHVNDDAGAIPSSHEFHDLAVAADGAVFVSWLDERKLDAAGAVSPAAQAHTAEQVAELRVARSSDRGKSFDPGVVVDADGCICCRTAVACRGADTVFVMFRKVYQGEHGAEHDMAVARSFDGGRTFQPAVRVHADHWVLQGCPDIGPDIAIGDGGELVVAWYTGAPGREGLYASVSHDAGASFGDPLPILTGTSVPASEIKLAPARGRVWAVWEDAATSAHQIRLAPIPLAGGKLEPVTLGQGKSPAIAAASSSIAVAWEDQGALRFVRRLP